jgi:hypothetical protein
MKKAVLSLVAIFAALLCYSQRVYIDVSNCESTPIEYNKPGWDNFGDPVFADEFNFTPSNPFNIDYHHSAPAGCTTMVNADRLKVVLNSDFNWQWRWNPNGWGDEPFYYGTEGISSGVDGSVSYLQLKTTYVWQEMLK